MRSLRYVFLKHQKQALDAHELIRCSLVARANIRYRTYVFCYIIIIIIIIIFITTLIIQQEQSHLTDSVRFYWTFLHPFLQMDVQFMRKLSVSTTVWLSLFFATIITDVIGKATSLSAVIWPIHSISVGISFTGLKIWNRFILAEPLLDVNLNCIEMSISIVLAMMVSLFGGVLFQLEPIQNSTASLVLAIVMTTCQFSLLKVSQYSLVSHLKYNFLLIFLIMSPP